MRKYLYLLLFIVFNFDTASAVTYFSDFVNGNDANAGTSMGSPWKRMPGMDNELVGIGFSPGDIICLKGGVTWPDRVIGAAGVSYYSVGGSEQAKTVCAGWGNGKAIIDVPAVLDAFGAFQITNSGNNITVDGLRLINRVLSSTSLKGAFYAQGASGAEITGLRVRNIEGTLSANGFVILSWANNWVVENSDFSDNIGSIGIANCIGSGLFFSNSGGVSNNFNGIVRNVTANRNAPTCIATTNENNGRGISFANEGGPVTVIGSLFMNNGGNNVAGIPDGAQIDAGGYNGVRLIGNKFIGQTAAEIKANADNWLIEGNLFVGTSAAPFQYGFFSTDSIGSTIINNTFVGSNKLAFTVVELSSPGTSTVFKNNLIVCPVGMENTPSFGVDAAAIKIGRIGGGWAQTTWDNNISHNYVQGCQTYINEILNGGSITSRTLPAHQSAYPLQAQNSGHVFDGGTPYIRSEQDYRIRPLSPTRQSGFAYHGCIDVRGRNCNWPPDIGAYQSSPGDLAMPRGLRP